MPILGVIASSYLSAPAVPNSYESIQTVSVGTAQSTISFSSIPATYTHLQIRGILRNTASGTGSLDLYMRFNSDSTSNYRAYKQIGGDGSSAFAAASGLATVIGPNYFLKDGSTANVYAVWICDIIDYKNTNKYKVARSLSGQDLNGSGHFRFFSGLWRSTSAITSIDLTVETGTNFQSYSHFALYGIKG
jgi:hypothetical protein